LKKSRDSVDTFLSTDWSVRLS